MKIGIGYDIHRLSGGDKLIIGGIEIPFNKGVIAHSDGDVLIHALCDAILGAIGMPDLGERYPDTDPKYKNISSVVFLEDMKNVLKEKEKVIVNIDSVVMLESPKLQKYKEKIRKKIAETLEIQEEQVNVKAKTFEGMTEIGVGNAIAAHVIVLINN